LSPGLDNVFSRPPRRVDDGVAAFGDGAAEIQIFPEIEMIERLKARLHYGAKIALSWRVLKNKKKYFAL
jgi:hypothetical protein